MAKRYLTLARSNALKIDHTVMTQYYKAIIQRSTPKRLQDPVENKLKNGRTIIAGHCNWWRCPRTLWNVLNTSSALGCNHTVVPCARDQFKRCAYKFGKNSRPAIQIGRIILYNLRAYLEVLRFDSAGRVRTGEKKLRSPINFKYRRGQHTSEVLFLRKQLVLFHFNGKSPCPVIICIKLYPISDSFQLLFQKKI